MRRYSTFIVIGGIFMAISALLYFYHYSIIRDVHHIFIYMVGDLAFLPLEVFLVVIVIERILAHREKQAILQKLNMVVGAFFSEVGTELLHRLLPAFGGSGGFCRQLAIDPSWTRADFRKAVAFANAIEERPDCLNLDMEGLRTFLIQKRQFMVGLLENPNLLEYERFTDLLWATFHLAEELEARSSVKDLPETDFQHLAVDIQRVSRHLAAEWVSYAEHLKANYPFLFSLMVRLNPFAECPSAVVT